VLLKLALPLLLMALCVVIHASGVTLALRRLGHAANPGHRFWRSALFGVRIAAWMIVCHLIEIAVWATVYDWNRAMPDLQTALYFSAVTYTTTGYGDVVLAPEWRLTGGVEALTGILMCGWSAAFFFAVISRSLSTDSKAA
jgi:hypothetical protein